MAFEIQLAQPADAPKLAEAFFAAFCDRFNRSMFPDKPDARAWMTKNMLGGEGISENQILLKVTDPSNPDVVAGFAKWIRPSAASAVHDRQATFPAWPESSDGRLCDLFFGTMDGAHKEIMGERPHYCKSILLWIDFVSHFRHFRPLLFESSTRSRFFLHFPLQAPRTTLNSDTGQILISWAFIHRTKDAEWPPSY